MGADRSFRIDGPRGRQRAGSANLGTIPGFFLRLSDRQVKRIAFVSAWPDDEAGKRRGEPAGEVLDADAFARVMTGENDRDPQGFGLERSMEPRLARDEHVRTARGRQR